MLSNRYTYLYTSYLHQQLNNLQPSNWNVYIIDRSDLNNNNNHHNNSNNADNNNDNILNTCHNQDCNNNINDNNNNNDNNVNIDNNIEFLSIIATPTSKVSMFISLLANMIFPNTYGN